MNVGTIEGLIRLRDEFSSSLARAASQLQQTGAKMQVVGAQISSVGSTLTRTVSLPLIAMGGYAIKAAIDFESSFAGVRKTVNATEEEFAQLSSSIRELAAGPNAIPIDVNELNAVAESAGQLGIAKDDILAFTETMANLGETTNLTAIEASESIAQFQNIFGEAGKHVDRFGSALVALGNDGASTEKQILEMGLRIAGAGNQIGLSQGEVLAFASALSSVGIEAEAGGSALSKVMINMALAVSKGGNELQAFGAIAGQTSSEFAASFRDDAAQAVSDFVQGLGKLKDQGGDVLGTLDKMGISEVRMRDALLRAAGAGDLLTKSLKLQSAAWSENSALTDEARKRYQTFESQLRIVWNRIKDTAITLGTSLLPILRDLLDILQPLLAKFSDWAKAFADLPKPIRLTVLALGGLLAAAGPVLVVLGQLITAYGAIIAIAPRVVAAIASISTAFNLAGVAIVGLLLLINRLIVKWGEASSAAIEASVRMAEAEGRAFDFSRQVGQDGGLVSKETFDARLKDAELLKSRIVDLQSELTKLKRIAKEGSPDQAFISGVSSIPEKEQELKGLWDAYGKIRTALAKVKVIAEDVDRVLPPGGGRNPLPLPDMSMTEDQIKAYADLMESMKAQIAGNRQIIAEYGKSVRAGNLRADSLDRESQATELAAQFTGVYRDSIKSAALAVSELQARVGDAQFLAQMRESVKLSRDRFDAAGGTAQAILKQEIAEAQLAAVMNLSIHATREMIAEAKALAKADVIAANATNARAEAERLFAEASKDRLLSEFDRNVEQIARDSAGISIDPTGQVLAGIFATLNRRMEEFADGVKASLVSITESYKQYKDKIRAAVKDNKLTAEEGQQAIARVERQRWDDTLAAADQALAYLGDKLGGFFSAISQLLNNIQGARQFGRSVGQAAEGLGATVNQAAAISNVASVFAIYYAIYTGVQDWIKKKNLKKFGQSAEFAISGGLQDVFIQDNPDTGKIDEWGREFAKSMRGLIKSIEESLGISINELTKLSVKFRRDGEQIRAYVGDTFVGLFSNINDALQAALVVALRDSDTVISGLSDLMRQGLDTRMRAEDLDQLTEFLSQLREISNLSLTASTIQVREAIRHIDELFTALTRLRSATPAVVEGFNNLITAQVQTFQSWRNQITGHQETQAEIKARFEAEARLFNAEKALRIADLNLRLAQYKEEVEFVRLRGQLGGIDGRIGRQRLQLQFDELKVRAAIVNSEKTLLENQISMLDAMIKAIEDTIAALSAIPDIDLSEIKLPRAGGGAGGGDQDSVRSFIQDRRFTLATSVLGEYLRQVAEVTREYDRQIEQAGRDITLRGELIALREQELSLLAKERAATLVSSFREFLGLINPFDQVRKTATDLIKQIEDSPFGDARKARMIGRILAELEDQLSRLALESASSLLSTLSSDLEKFGATTALQTEVRNHLAIIEHTLKLEHYRTEIAILKAQGRLTIEVLKTLEDGLRFLGTVDPTKFIGGKQPPGVTPRVSPRADLESAADLIKRGRDLLKKYQEDALTPLARSLHEINEDFKTIRSALGATPEVVLAQAAAIKRAIDNFLEPIRNVQRDILFGDQSAVDTMSQWSAIQGEFARAVSKFRAGDLSIVSDVPDLVQQLLSIAQQVTPIGSEAYRDIFKTANQFLNEILAITPDTVSLGSVGNPMNVTMHGITDLAAISEAQLDRLYGIETSGLRVASAMERLDSKIGYGGGLASVA